MLIVYRYTDCDDNIIKYVGIVWGEKASLRRRAQQHACTDNWCKNRKWKIEYLDYDIKSRTDAEMLEAHFIAKFGTESWYNSAKTGWGESQFVQTMDDSWQLFSIGEEIKMNPLSRKPATVDLDSVYRDPMLRYIKKVYGAETFLIWIELLHVAISKNSCRLQIDDKVILNDVDKIAAVIDEDITAVKKAIDIFEKHGLIRRDEDRFVYIQNLDNFIVSCSKESPDTKVKEQNRIRQRRWRQKQKEHKSTEVPYREIVELYNKNCIQLPAVKRLTDKRKNMIRLQYIEYNHNIEVFREVFKNASESELLNGKNDNGWTADLEWILKPNNFSKLYEGIYSS